MGRTRAKILAAAGFDLHSEYFQSVLREEGGKQKRSFLEDPPSYYESRNSGTDFYGGPPRDKSLWEPLRTKAFVGGNRNAFRGRRPQALSLNDGEDPQMAPGPQTNPGPQTLVLNLAPSVPHVPPVAGSASEGIPAEDSPELNCGGTGTTSTTDVGVDTSPQTSTTTTTTTTSAQSPSSGPGGRELPHTNPAIGLVEDQSHPHSDDSARCVLLIGGLVLLVIVIIFGFDLFCRNCIAEDE